MKSIYNELLRRKLVRSLRHFSTEFLCRSPNYAVDASTPSMETLSFLHARLMQYGQDDLALQVLLMIFDRVQETLCCNMQART